MTPAMRERAFIATKVWTHGQREGVQQMTKSAELMKRPKLDLIQVHNLQDLDTQLKTLRAWKEEGRVRYIGITHYTVGSQSDLAKVIEREKLDFVQLNYSATTRNAEQRLLPLAADKGVAVLVNRPFEDGGMFNAVRGKPVPPWAADIDATSWGQIFLKYVLAHPAVTAAIPATGKLHHLEDNLAGARGRLPDAKHQSRDRSRTDVVNVGRRPHEWSSVPSLILTAVPPTRTAVTLPSLAVSASTCRMLGRPISKPCSITHL